MKINVDQFKKIFGEVKNADAIVAAMNEIFPKFEINTKDRMAAFLAQAGHESGGFRLCVENLNYSAKALVAVFGKYFPTMQAAALYERKPEKIANKVYGNRMGNGDEASGDGFRFRGRGYIQLTGKNNYVACGKDLGLDLVKDPSYLETIEGALMSACWFWRKNALNAIADKKDMNTLTRRINGGLNGLDDRLKYYNKAIAVL